VTLTGEYLIESVNVLHALLTTPRRQLVHGNVVGDAEVLVHVNYPLSLKPDQTIDLVTDLILDLVQDLAWFEASSASVAQGRSSHSPQSSGLGQPRTRPC